MIADAVVRALRRGLANLLAPGVVLLVDDAKKVQEIQAGLLAGETRSGLRRLQGYGFTSHPLPGAEVLAAFVGGNRDHGFVIGLDDRRYRLALAAGEVAIFDDQGQKVHLTRDGIVIETAQPVTVKGSAISLEADTTIKGNAIVEGAVLAAGNVTAFSGGAAIGLDAVKATYNGHTHNENDAAPGPTGAPNQQI